MPQLILIGLISQTRAKDRLIESGNLQDTPTLSLDWAQCYFWFSSVVWDGAEGRTVGVEGQRIEEADTLLDTALPLAETNMKVLRRNQIWLKRKIVATNLGRLGWMRATIQS